MVRSLLKAFSKRYGRHDKGLLNRSVNSILHLEGQKLSFIGAYNSFEKLRISNSRVSFSGKKTSAKEKELKHL